MYALLALLLTYFLSMFTAADSNDNDKDKGSDDNDKDKDKDKDADDDGDGGDDDDSDDSDDDDDSDIKAELKRTREALKKANKEAKDRRLKLKKLEKAEAERAKAEMSDLEKMQTELDAATAERDSLKAGLTEVTIRHAFHQAANALGFVDPDDAYDLVDRSEIEFDEETLEVTGIDKLLKALAKAKPYLLSATDDDTTTRGTPGSRKKRVKDKKDKKGTKDDLPERSMVRL